MPAPADRRPLKTRDAAWAKTLATRLARRGVTPNAISLLSVACAALACLGFVATHWTPRPVPRAIFLLVAVAGMQLRLLCNLLDGMVAVEAGAGTGEFGEIYNDLPDRVADVVIFAGAGVCAGGVWGPVLGLAAATGSLFTAYVRVLGKSLGARSHFAGPMAKPHRMATMTVAGLVATVLVFLGPWLHDWMRLALVVVVAGCVVTAWRRVALVVADVRAL